MRAQIVLGLGFGDEGKGVTTDYLCSHFPNETIVVRFSGGQQAGHTVHREGYKHIFSSFGSGTLGGCPTYISEHCTIYPPNIINERNVLKENPVLYLHPLTMLTTPYDVVFNRWKEGIKKDGSCGIGVGATMARNLQSPYKLYAVDLLDRDMLMEKLKAIETYYYNKTWNEYGVRTHNSFMPKMLKEEMESFLSSIETPFMKNVIQNIANYEILQQYSNIVFEGSQGILLDMDHGIFPNVTYAHTTSKNAMEICQKIGIAPEQSCIFYVTRCYQTRHGEGWMSNNLPITLINNEGETNCFNKWQGNFRTGELDISLINYSLTVDSAYYNSIDKNLVVTCLDQRPNYEFPYNKISTKFLEVYENHSPQTELINIGYR